MRLLILIILVLCTLPGLAQPKTYTTANAHSHNDYANPTPFYVAFENGFGSIEADIFSVHDTLFVAHNKQDIRPGRTLKSLYLDPLLQSFEAGKKRTLSLLVDVKDDYKTSLALLIKELTPINKLLSTGKKKNYLTIIISGNRPPPNEYKNYPSYIFFDDDRKLAHSKSEWNRVGLVSLPLYNVSRWNGKDPITPQDSLAVKRLVDSVHTAGKRIRFWSAPDNELSWQLQMNLKVDLIGTDKITELAAFINRK